METADSTGHLRRLEAVLKVVSCVMAMAVLSVATSTGAAEAAELRGTVRLVKPGGKPVKELHRILVYYTPRGGAERRAPPAEPFELKMSSKKFEPSSLIIPRGSTVRFPNDDTILHNVFSVSGRNRFDLGLYRRGTGKEATFNYPGVVRVFCNVHHSMVAHLVVVNTPYYTVTEADGSFRLSGLPAGEGELTLWFERSEAWNQEVTLPQQKALSVDLEVTKGKVPDHTNKFNQPYKRRSRGKAYR